MKRRHKNQDHGWNTEGVPDRGIKMPDIRTTRARFKEFARRHNMTTGRLGRLEIQEDEQ